MQSIAVRDTTNLFVGYNLKSWMSTWYLMYLNGRIQYNVDLKTLKKSYGYHVVIY